MSVAGDMTSGRDFLRESLTEYVSNSRLSMSQIARKLEISPPMLSQIKNGKKKPSLELGLKILDQMGASFDHKKEWLFERAVQESPEAEKIKQSLEGENKDRMLKDSLMARLEADKVLRNVFLDISIAQELGVHWSQISEAYGKQGLDLAKDLIEAGVVTYRESRYWIDELVSRNFFGKVASFGVMKGVFEELKAQAAKENISYEFSFDITDVSKEGFDELRALAKEYKEKSRKIIDKHALSNKNGGFRIVSQQIVSSFVDKIKALALIGLIPFMVVVGDSGWASGGGLAGGGSADFARNTNSSFSYRGDRFHWQQIRLHQTYYTKDDARRAAVIAIQNMRSGNLIEEAIRAYRRPIRTRHDDCRTHINQRRHQRDIAALLAQGKMRPSNFTISETYDSSSGDPRFTYNLPIDVPCHLPDRD